MEMENYDKQFESIVSSFNGEKRKLLLHSCCAPCTSAVLERVTPFFNVTLFFYNPNITDKLEYEKRLSELHRYVNAVYSKDIQIIDGGFCPEVFFELAKGKEKLKEGGERCFSCYKERLQKTCDLASLNGFEFFTTTLSVSPYKNAEKLNLIGFEVSQQEKTKFLPSDFKKKGGYVRSIELSKKYSLYRQDYCGCVFSKEDRARYLAKDNQ